MMASEQKKQDAPTVTAELEALLFMAHKPLSLSELQGHLPFEEMNTKKVLHALSQLENNLHERKSALSVAVDEQGNYLLKVKDNNMQAVKKMLSGKLRPLSRAAQETLSIIAYRQPVTRADIEFIRGVDAGGILKNLLDKGIIQCLGRKEDAGKPLLFGTTNEFLQLYNLKSCNDLPPLESFQPKQQVMKAAKDKMSDQDSATKDNERLIV